MPLVPLSPWLAHRPRRGATVIDTVVLHASRTDDTDELIRELRASDHSYHYIIERDGTVRKCVPYPAVAFHTGISYGPHEAARGVSGEEHTCVIEYSIGVCFVNLNDGFDPYTREQIGACAALLTDLKTPLPKLRWLTTDALVSKGRHDDPMGFDVFALAKRCGLEVWTGE